MKKVKDICTMDDTKRYLYVHGNYIRWDKKSDSGNIKTITYIIIDKITTRDFGYKDSSINSINCIGNIFNIDYRGMSYFKRAEFYTIYNDWTQYLFELNEEEMLEHFIWYEI